MEIRRGNKFQHFTNMVEVLEREDNVVLTKLTSNGPGSRSVSYDISNITLDHDGRELYKPSPNHNGMTPEDEVGGVRTPKPLEHMQAEFNRVVEASRKQRQAQKEARERMSNGGVDKRMRIDTARQRRVEYETALAERLQGKSIETALDDKKTRGLAMEIAALDMMIKYIR